MASRHSSMALGVKEANLLDSHELDLIWIGSRVPLRVGSLKVALFQVRRRVHLQQWTAVLSQMETIPIQSTLVLAVSICVPTDTPTDS